MHKAFVSIMWSNGGAARAVAALSGAGFVASTSHTPWLQCSNVSSGQPSVSTKEAFPAVPAGDATIKGTVLIVIDVQNGFIRERTTLPVVPKVVAITEEWLRRGGAVVATRFVNSPGSPYENLLRWRGCAAGSKDTQLCESLQCVLDKASFPGQVHIINKCAYSSFTDELRSLAKARGWTQFAIVGFSSHACVFKTAVDCFELGYRPIVLADGCASHNATPECDLHAFTLEILPKVLGKGQVTTSKEFLA